MTCVLLRDRREDIQRGQSHVKTESEVVVMQPQTKDHQKLGEMKTDSPLELSEVAQPWFQMSDSQSVRKQFSALSSHTIYSHFL